MNPIACAQNGSDNRFAITPVPNVVLAYEDYLTGTNAVCILNHFAQHNGLPADFGTHNAWKFEILSLPALRNIAATEAAAADLVVLSTHGFDRLPGLVLDWIELWLSWRTFYPAAFLALVDDNNSPSVEHYLDHCVRERGMLFSTQTVGSRSHSDEGAFGIICQPSDETTAAIEEVMRKLTVLRTRSSRDEFTLQSQ